MKEFFDATWQELKQIYFDGRICSERHMQCEIFRVLTNNIVFDDQYQIFTEPRLTTSLGSKIPDFLIFSKEKKKVTAVVELKYVPHSYSQHEKDLDTLIGFANIFKNSPEFSFPLITDPSTGEWTKDRFTFDKELLLIFCVITKVDAYVITNHTELWKCDDSSHYGSINYLQYVGAIPADLEDSWRCL